MNTAPARVSIAYAEDERCLGFLIARGGTILAVDLAGQEFGPYRTQEAAVAALSRERKFDFSRRLPPWACPTPSRDLANFSKVEKSKAP